MRNRLDSKTLHVDETKLHTSTRVLSLLVLKKRFGWAQFDRGHLISLRQKLKGYFESFQELAQLLGLLERLHVMNALRLVIQVLKTFSATKCKLTI